MSRNFLKILLDKANGRKLNCVMMIAKLKKIVSRHPQIAAAYLYGTAVGGKLRPNSDIDVALLIVEPYTQKELVSLETHVICDIEAAFHLFPSGGRSSLAAT